MEVFKFRSLKKIKITLIHKVARQMQRKSKKKAKPNAGASTSFPLIDTQVLPETNEEKLGVEACSPCAHEDLSYELFSAKKRLGTRE